MTRTPTPPPHGERRCYLRGCRRPECVAASRRYCKQYKLRQHRQGLVHIDATEVRNHILGLMAAGCSQKGIATAAGVATGAVQAIAAATSKKVRPETARAILAIRISPGSEPLGHWTNPTGTVRRIQALAALGYPMYETAKALGISYSALRFIGRETRNSVSRELAARTAELYAVWSRQPGPSSHSRGKALARGWHEPSAWDDIDDPNETPDAAPEMSRAELAAYRRQEIAHLASFGIPEHDIASRLDMAPHYVHDLLRDMRKAA